MGFPPYPLIGYLLFLERTGKPVTVVASSPVGVVVVGCTIVALADCSTAKLDADVGLDGFCSPLALAS